MSVSPKESASSRDLLKAILDAIPDVICSKDRNLLFTGCNAAFEAFAGRPVVDFLGQTCDAFFTDPWADRARTAEMEVIRIGQSLQGEDWVVYPDGRRVLLDILFAPVKSTTGEVSGLVIIGRDVTERRKLEDQLRQSQKLDAVGQLAGGVAHDFNNLLTVILSNLELSRRKPSPEYLSAATTAARRAAELTGQLLGFARRQPLRCEPVDINDRLRETAGLIRHTIDPRIVLKVVLSTTPTIVLGDPGQINQVLLNLCLNARDAMPNGGTLTLAARCENSDVILQVSDTGNGMSPEVQARIFEPFFTTKGIGEGTGLGLAVAFGIVEAHGGRIQCQSRIGVGTTFEILLPSHAAAMPKVPTKTHVPETADRGARILLADDEPMIRDLAQRILEPQGHTLTLVGDGEEAVAKFREMNGAFDLVILDLAMPNLTGRDALQQIRELSATVPVLMTSGYSLDRGAAAEEATAFLEKPFTPTDLITAVTKAIRNS